MTTTSIATTPDTMFILKTYNRGIKNTYILDTYYICIDILYIDMYINKQKHIRHYANLESFYARGLDMV